MQVAAVQQCPWNLLANKKTNLLARLPHPLFSNPQPSVTQDAGLYEMQITSCLYLCLLRFSISKRPPKRARPKCDCRESRRHPNDERRTKLRWPKHLYDIVFVQFDLHALTNCKSSALLLVEPVTVEQTVL